MVGSKVPTFLSITARATIVGAGAQDQGDDSGTTIKGGPRTVGIDLKNDAGTFSTGARGISNVGVSLSTERGNR